MRPRPGGWGGGIVLTVAFVPGRMPRKAAKQDPLRSDRGVTKPRNMGVGHRNPVSTVRTRDATKVQVLLGDGPERVQVLVYPTTTVQDARTKVQQLIDTLKPGYVATCLGLPGSGALLPLDDHVLDHLDEDEATLRSMLAPVAPPPVDRAVLCVADLNSIMQDYLRTALLFAKTKMPPGMMGRIPGFAVFGMGETNMR